MVKKKAWNYKYTKEYCFDIAKKYKLLSKFRRENASLCVISRQNGWYEEMTKHMFRKNAKNMPRCFIAFCGTLGGRLLF